MFNRPLHRSLPWIVTLAAGASALARQSPELGFPSSSYVDGGDQYDLAAADFDGDGREELVVAESANAVHVLWTDANARVVSRTSLPTGVEMQAVATGDVDGNGSADIVAVEWGSGSGSDRMIHVWLGDGAGNLSALPPQIGGNGDPWQIALGDATGDGVLDLFWGGPSVFEGDGAGHFTQISFSAYFGVGNGMTVADFDQDGKADVAWGASTVSPSVWVYLSDGAGGFTPSASPSLGARAPDVDAADIDGDGLLDLVCTVDTWQASRLQVVLGNGSGGFGAPIVSNVLIEPEEVEAADFDGDGVVELLVTDLAASAVTVMKNFGGGVFRPVGQIGAPYFMDRVLLADLDGDGDRDFACIDTHHDGVHLARHLGYGVFDTPSVFAVPSSRFFGMAAGDLDGDGLDEVVAANNIGTGLVVIRPLPGGGFVSPAGPFLSDVGPRAVALGDLDEDGALDAVVAHYATTNLVAMLGDGAGALTSNGMSPVPGRGIDVVLGDWNGDQHLDAALAMETPNGIAVLLGDGTGSLSLASTVLTSSVPTSIVTHDFDGDSIPDLALASDATAPLSLHLGDGSGGFATGTALPASSSMVVDIRLADVNGDANRDLVVAHASSPELELLLADAQGGFTPVTVSAYIGSPLALDARDVDGDSDADVFVLDGQSGIFTVLLGDPSGSPTLGGTFLLPIESAGAFAVGRFDGDPYFDVAAGSSGYFNSLTVSGTSDSVSGASVFCTAKTNSLGCKPTLGLGGTPSESAASGFTISAHWVLSQKVGLFFYSTNGPNNAPFLGGTLCVKPPTHRTSLQNSGGNPPPIDCSGQYTLDFNAQIALGQDPGLTAGTSVAGQFWSRDPGFAAPNNVGLTAAVRFTIQP